VPRPAKRGRRKKKEGKGRKDRNSPPMIPRLCVTEKGKTERGGGSQSRSLPLNASSLKRGKGKRDLSNQHPLRLLPLSLSPVKKSEGGKKPCVSSSSLAFPPLYWAKKKKRSSNANSIDPLFGELPRKEKKSRKKGKGN